MRDHGEDKGLCIVCKEAITGINTEMDDGRKIFVCEKCLETTKENFIWICMGCGTVYIRPKSIVLKRLSNPGLKKAYDACKELQILQGIDRCIECDPEGIVEFVAASRSDKKGEGHC